MDNFVNWPPTWATLLLVPALLVGFTVHELAHAVVAYLLGDTSQVERKRLSFNPLRHVSWLGMVAFLLIGIGWAKPVWVDHTRFRIKNRAFGMFLVSIAGASANFLTGLLAVLGISGTVMVVWMLTGTQPAEVVMFLVVQGPGPDVQGLAVALSTYMVSVNLLLAFFNLLPLPPLDGFQALISLISLIRSAFQRGPEGRPATWLAATTTDGEPAPSPAQIHFGIGLEYQKAGQVDEAIARYRQAIAQDEQFALAYYNLGVAYLTKGRLPLATSAFKAAMQSSHELSVRVQADLRLRELAQTEQDPETATIRVPPPLEPGTAPEPAGGEVAPLDPAVARRVWLRLGIGGALMLLSTVMVWLFVTGVTLEAMM